jgi:hypothetical protein
MQYPTSYIPPNHFHLPLASSPLSYDGVSVHQRSIWTRHGIYPNYRRDPDNRVYFLRRQPAAIPPIALPAALLYFARMARWKHQIPPHLPRNRQESIQRARARIQDTIASGVPFGTPGFDWTDGTRGPTAEDIEEWNGEGPHVNPLFPGRTLLPPRKDLAETFGWSFAWSQLRDHEFNRIRLGCPWPLSYYRDWRDGHGVGGALKISYGAKYTPGLLTGLWVGSMMVCLLHDYLRLHTLTTTFL